MVHLLAAPGCPVDIDHQAVIGHVAEQLTTDRYAAVPQKNDAGMALLNSRPGFEVCWFPHRTEPVRRIISIEN
jgi:hypothetical protein